MYQHTVSFSLVHAPDSDAERAFIDESRSVLTGIEGVQDFAVHRQVSPKSELRWQFFMTFADEAAFEAYAAHPVHTAYVAERWVPEVRAFQELDFVRHA